MKQKRLVIGLNIANVVILTALILGVLYATLAVSIIFGIFGQEVFNSVLAELFKYSLILNVPNFFIVVVTIVSLASVLCRKNEKNVKKIETFTVFHIICLVLSILLILAPFCIGLFQFIRNSLQNNGGSNDWDGIWVIVLFVCLEGFSLMTNIITVKYLSNLQRSLEYGE